MSAAPTPPPEYIAERKSGRAFEKATTARRLYGSNTIDAPCPQATPSLLTNAPPGRRAPPIPEPAATRQCRNKIFALITLAILFITQRNDRTRSSDT